MVLLAPKRLRASSYRLKLLHSGEAVYKQSSLLGDASAKKLSSTERAGWLLLISECAK